MMGSVASAWSAVTARSVVTDLMRRMVLHHSPVEGKTRLRRVEERKGQSVPARGSVGRPGLAGASWAGQVSGLGL